MLKFNSNLDNLEKKMIKRIFLFIILTLLLINIASATDITNEGFESGVIPVNWTVYNNAANRNWYIANTNPYSGTYNAQVYATGVDKNAYLEASFSTLGYSSINVSYYRQLVGLDGPDDFIVQWYDGSAYHTLEQLGTASENKNYVYKEFILPTEATNNINFKLRFTCENGATTEYCRVDNVLISGSVEQSEPNPIDYIADSNIEYKIYNNNNSFAITINPQYNDNGVWKDVNRTLKLSTESGYEYGVTEGIYEAHFKNLPSSTSAVLIRRGIELAYDPNGLYWDSSSDDDIIDANPNGEGNPDPNDPTSFIYPNAYGDGIDLKYTYLATELKEYVIINNRLNLGTPPSTVLQGNNISLKHEFALHNINNADLYIDDQLITSNGDYIGKEAYFKFNNSKIFNLETPYAYDSEGNEVYGWYKFRKTLGDLWVELHIPYDWINTATYPVYIDPTTVIVTNTSLFINLSDTEYEPVKSIQIEGFIDNGNNTVLYDNFQQEHDFANESYAIDLSYVEFDYANITTNVAKGESLYKCPTWNFTSRDCMETLCEDNDPECIPSGGWILYTDDLSVGEEYNFILEPGDPAYFEYTSSPDQSSTTATTYQDKISTSINVTEEGTYLIMARAGLTSQNTGTSVFARIGVDGTYYNEYVAEAKDSNPALEYPQYTAFIPLNLTVGIHTLEMQWRSETAATTSLIRGATMVALKINETNNLHLQSNLASQEINVLTYGTDYSTLTFTPDRPGDYIIFVSGRMTHSNTATSISVQATLDGSQIGEQTFEPQDATDIMTFGFSGISRLNVASHTISLEGYTSNAGDVSTIDNIRIIAFRLEENSFSEDLTETSTTSATYVTKLSKTFIPIPDRNYLVITQGETRSGGTGDSTLLRTTIDGTSYCSYVKEPKDVVGTIDYYTYTCFENVSYSTDTPIVINLDYASDTGGTLAYLKNAKISIIPYDDDNGVIKFDTASYSAPSANNLSFSHTFSNNSNMVLIVGVESESPPAENASASSVLWGSTPLTRYRELYFNDAGADNAVSIWYLLNPTPGTDSISVNFNSGADGTVAGAISLYNVAQEPPEAYAEYNQSGITEISTNITTLTDGAWIVDLVGSGNPGTYTTNRVEQMIRWQENTIGGGAAGVMSTMYIQNATTIATQYNQAANRLVQLVTAWKPFTCTCCPPSNQDWLIDTEIICNATNVDIGTGRINITTNGSLMLINNANVTSSNMPLIQRWRTTWHIWIERGSELIFQR